MKYVGWHKIYNIFGLKFKAKYLPKHIKNIYIVFQEQEGIGNRIFGLVNAINYFSPEKINVYWPNSGWVSDSLFNLFQIENYNIIEFNNKDEFEKKAKKEKNSILIEQIACNLKTKNGVDLSQKFNNIKQENKKEFQEIFKNIKPNKDIENFINKHNGNEFIALQIRNAPDWEEYGRNSNIESFISKLDTYPKSTNFYLSAMNENIGKILKEKKFNIIELKDKKYNSMKDAIVDLFTLAKAKKGIYSYGSTFGELAFWLNGAMQEIEIIGNNENWITPIKK